MQRSPHARTSSVLAVAPMAELSSIDDPATLELQDGRDPTTNGLAVYDEGNGHTLKWSRTTIAGDELRVNRELARMMNAAAMQEAKE